jgi:hypothetical protein
MMLSIIFLVKTKLKLSIRTPTQDGKIPTSDHLELIDIAEFS